MRDVQASNLRFTVYTTRRGASSEVVELLNTGMIATSMFEDDDSRGPAAAVEEQPSTASSVVLDFDVDVSEALPPFCDSFLRASLMMRASCAHRASSS